MARNSITLAGTLVQDSELTYTPAGFAILEVNIAGSTDVLDENKEVRPITWYHRFKLFSAYAETMSNVLKAGVSVLVSGRLNHNTWETPEGQRRSRLEIIGDQVETISVASRGDEPTIVDSRGQHRLKNAVNEVRIMGNLTRDAELRYTPNGHPVTNFSVAVNERFTGKDGPQERVHFVDVNAWRDLALIAGDLAKGAGVFVTGRLMNDDYTDKEGNRRYVTRLEADRIEILERGNQAGARPAAKNTAAASAPAGGGRLDIDEEFPPEEDLPF